MTFGIYIEELLTHVSKTHFHLGPDTDFLEHVQKVWFSSRNWMQRKSRVMLQKGMRQAERKVSSLILIGYYSMTDGAPRATARLLRAYYGCS